jgi:hypothetical protein
MAEPDPKADLLLARAIHSVAEARSILMAQMSQWPSVEQVELAVSLLDRATEDCRRLVTRLRSLHGETNP